MSSGNKKPSWRGQGTQQSYRPPTKSKNLGKRRWAATLFFTLLVLAFGIVAAISISSRFPQTTLISILGTQGILSNESSDKLSIAPIRFSKDFPARMEKLRSEEPINFSIADPLSLVDLSKLEKSIAAILSPRSSDTLVCVVQAQGISIHGKPFLITSNFELPKSSEPSNEYKGAIAVSDFLAKFDRFPGNTIIALDAGDVVADQEAMCDQNEFLLLLKDLLKNQIKNNRLWVLTSHSPGEISQDNMRLKCRLFGRALAEALTGKLRLPEEDETTFGSDRKLTLDEIANYVHRRVFADSAQTQNPWLLRGATGYVESNKSTWPEATSIRVAKLNSNGLLDGIAKLPKPTTAAPNQPSKDSVASKTESPGNPTSNNQESPPKDGVATSPDIWIENWISLKKAWDEKAVNRQNLSWTFAECFPTDFRAARAKLLDSELRNRAGIDLISSWEPTPTPKLPPKDAERLLSFFPTDSNLNRWDPLELKKAQADAMLLQQICRASLSVAEIRQLKYRLETLNETPGPSLNRIVSMFESASKNQFERDTLRQSTLKELPTESQLEQDLDAIVKKTLINKKPAVLESLLLCNLLTPQQRAKVLKVKEERIDAAEKTPYPTSILLHPSSWDTAAKASSTSNSLEPRKAIDLTSSKRGPNTASQSTFTSQVADLIWEALSDDRQIAILSQSNTQYSKLALLPETPKNRDGWFAVWEQVGVSSINPANARIRLDGSKLRFRIKLDPFPQPSAVLVKCTQSFQAISNIKVNEESLKMSNPISQPISWDEFEKKGRLIDIELETSAGEQPSDEDLQFSFAGTDGPPTETISLPIRVVGTERLELGVKRLASVEGNDKWFSEPSILSGTGITLKPFAGHATKFAFEITNKSEKPRTVKADVYALPRRAMPDCISGRLFTNGQFIDKEKTLDDAKQASLSAPIASSQAIEIKSFQSAQMNFGKETKADEPGKADNATKEKPPADGAALPLSSDSNGLLVSVYDVNDKSFKENFYLEYLPIQPASYVQAEIKVVDKGESKVVEIYPSFLDRNSDNTPDLSPTTSKPLGVKVFPQSWMGLSPEGILSNKFVPNQSPPAKLSLIVPGGFADSSKLNEPYLGIDIEGYPRALSKEISLQDRETQLLEPYRSSQPRGEIRSISDGATTYAIAAPNEDKKGAKADSKKERFSYLSSKRPVIFQAPSELSVIAALDWADDPTIGFNQRAVISLGEEYSFKVFGDRQWRFPIVNASPEGLSVEAIAEDHVIKIDTSGINNQKLFMSIELPEGASNNSFDGIEIVFDNESPRISNFEFTEKPTYKGDRGLATFLLDDGGLSGCDVATLKYVVEQNGEEKAKATMNFKSRTIRDKQQVPFSFATEKLEPGSYKLYVEATDQAGNGPNRSEPLNFRIIKRPDPVVEEKPSDPKMAGNAPPAAPPILGSISGTVRFRGGESVSEATVTLDSNGKTVTAKNGKFNFDEVPLGKYKLTAESEYQSWTWKGEKSGEFKKESDFNTPITIEVKK